MQIIRVADLVKEFSRPKRIHGAFGGLRSLVTRQRIVKRAIDHIGFDIEAGELVGYLGPNGAGKSTTVKILTGILRPTSGVVEVAGVTPWREREKNARNIGVVFGQRSQLWWDLPLRDSLELIGKLYGMSPRRHAAAVERFVEILDMASFVETPVRQLSLGQRMRGDLAAAMLPEPAILYLDEPTIGLDVVAKERIRKFIEDLNQSGTTVVLTTHDLGDVERLCRRIILIDHGKVLFDGDIAKLKANYAPHRRLVVKLAEGEMWRMPEFPGAELDEACDASRAVTLRFSPNKVQAPDLISAVLAQNRVNDLSIVEPELESIIHQFYLDRKLSVLRESALP